MVRHENLKNAFMNLWRSNKQSKNSRGSIENTSRSMGPNDETFPGIEIEKGKVHEMAKAGESALLKGKRNLYQHGGQIVEIIPAETERLRILQVGTDLLLSYLCEAAYWFRSKTSTRGAVTRVRSDPPTNVVRVIHAKGRWELPTLLGIKYGPTILQNGLVVTIPGYHPECRMLFEFDKSKFPQLPEKVDKEFAKAAMNRLSDLFTDFPFESPADRSVTLAALLTMVGREAFEGPAPMFIFDAHTPGTGKSFLADIISLIATGQPAPRVPYGNDEEVRKKITSSLMMAEPLILLDNVNRALGGASLDAALTSELWRDRALGSNNILTLPMKMVFLATGNNVSIKGDLARRVVSCRLEAQTEFPERRAGFKHQDLKGKVIRERPQLLMDVLAVLKGRVDQQEFEEPIASYGSFDGWSHLVRGALLWLDYPDPLQTQQRIRENSDEDRETICMLLRLLSDTYMAREFNTRNAFEESKRSREIYDGNPRLWDTIEAALDAKPEVALLSKLFSQIEGRIFNGYRLRKSRRRNSRGRLWRIERVTESSAGTRIIGSNAASAASAADAAEMSLRRKI